MRLRNIPGSDERLLESALCIDEPKSCKGHWSEVFDNSNPIHIEIGMGKGRFIMRQAEAHPDINYIGIEMYSSVLVRAVERAQALEEAGNMPANFRFIRMDARQIEEVFEYGEISKIYLNFSDPWPKERHAKRRLTSERFLKLYEKVLPKESVIEFKTDNADLFAFSLEQAEEVGWSILKYTDDLHSDREMLEGNIMTEYEEKFVQDGKPIHKMVIKQK